MERPWKIIIPENEKHIVLTLVISKENDGGVMDLGLVHVDADSRAFIDYKGLEDKDAEHFFLGKDFGPFTRAEIWGIMEEHGYELQFVSENITCANKDNRSDIVVSLYFRLKD